MTKATFDGTFNGKPGPTGADARCNDVASASSHALVKGRAFVAWISDGNTNASARHEHGTMPYVRPDGAIVANNWDSLVASPAALLAPINVYEDGTEVPAGTGVAVWTGTKEDGTSAGNTHCSNWTTTSPSGLTGAGGRTDKTDFSWTRAQDTPCTSRLRLYCIEK